MKRKMIFGIAGSLAASAVIAILLIIIGKASDWLINVLYSTLVFAGSMILCLACFAPIYRGNLKYLSYTGIIMIVINYLVLTVFIWLPFSNQIHDIMLAIAITDFGFAHFSLLVSLNCQERSAQLSQMLTIISTVVLYVLAYIVALAPIKMDDSTKRVLVIFVIISLLGAITTFVLDRIEDVVEDKKDVRKIRLNERKELLALLSQLNGEEFFETVKMIDTWKKVMSDKTHHIIVGLVDGKIVSTCTLTIVTNLTHSQRPYAIIENVVTDANYRHLGIATRCLEYAQEIAESRNCYKLMLMTGHVDSLDFFEKQGFNQKNKIGFIKWLNEKK